MEDVIRKIFNEVWQQRKGTEPPALEPHTLLLDTGLDSLEFAIIVTRLEDELGFDPFSIAEEAYYPETFGDFIAFYKKVSTV